MTDDLTLVLYMTPDKNGALKAEIENVDQAPGRKTPVTTISVADGRLSFKIDAFEGALSADGTQLTGSWTAPNSPRCR